MSNKIKVLRFDDLEWKMSRKIDGWFHSRLRGEPDGPRSFLIKANSDVKYYSWICENISEFFVLEGDLVVNDYVINKNDYTIIEPFIEIFNETKNGMLAICTVHGKVIWARDIFQKLLNDTLSNDEVELVIKDPWLSYLQSRVSKEIDGLSDKLVQMINNKDLTPYKKKLIELLITNK